MYGRESSSDPPSSSTGTNAGRPGSNVAPWSVRAEFTIRRGAEDDDDDGSVPPIETSSRSATIVPTTESTGVRMTYSFTPTQSPPYCTSPPSTVAPPPTYGFQRGNLMFTSTPPSSRSLLPVRSHTIPRTGYANQPQQQQQQPLLHSRPTVNYSDSGYTSEQVSSQSHSSLPTSEKRCKSTYSIVLSSAARNSANPTPYQTAQSQMTYPRPWSSYYQRQQPQQQPQTPCCRFSVVPEVCEDCAEAASGIRPFATHFCTRLADRLTTTGGQIGKVASATASKDAASQTTDIEAQNSPLAQRRKVRRKPTGAGALTASSGRDELKNNNFGRLSRTPASTKSPTPPASSEHAISDSSSNATTNTRDDNSEKRKRTVHIDVYCTGTDDDPNEATSSSSSSTEDDDDDDRATQTTVFEGTDVRITHTQGKSSLLPRGFQDEKAFLKRATERKCESFKHAPMRMPSLASTKGYESDDVLSSLYPSQFSSYSRLRDFESSTPWSAASSRSGMAGLDEYDSASATSWKDTVSDMESLINSKASITPCDSFEYADSVDRERIRKLETSVSKRAGMKAIKGKNWRSPQVERKHLLQGRMMKDYMEKHPPPAGWSSESSPGGGSSSGSEEEEVGWSFVSSEDNTSIVKGKLTFPAVSGGTKVVEETTTMTTTTTMSNQLTSATTTDQETSQSELMREVKTTIFRDRIGPFGSVSPSSTPSKLQSRVTSPFTTPQGEKTDHIIKASIFGRVVSTFRKPGHHVGPAKNPACSCEHCRRYFEDNNVKGRSRSLDNFERRHGSRASSATK